MQHKDYYHILGVHPDASQEQIKASFRTLAFNYHPDKNPGSLHAGAKFKEIKEAYDVLSDPAKRNAYHQNIFYPNFHYTHKKKAASPITAKNILQAVIHLNQQIAGMDPFRFNEELIFAKIDELLSDPHLEIIYREQDPELMEKLAEELIQASLVLPYAYILKLETRLKNLGQKNTAILQKTDALIRKKKNEMQWNLLKIPFAILMAVLFCILIYFMRN